MSKTRNFATNKKSGLKTGSFRQTQINLRRDFA